MGRVCDGYGVWGGGGALRQERHQERGQQVVKQTGVSIKDVLSATSTLPMMSIILPGSSIDFEEQAYLEWFIHGSATRTPKIFNSPFWDPVILQATMHEPMILQAVLALSSVHKRKVLDPTNRVRDGLPPDAQELFLLRQYSKAITNMRRHLEEDIHSDRSQLMLAVIMCGIFTLLEYVKGDYEAGQMHLACGGRLAKALLAYPDQAECEVKFIHFFARIADQNAVRVRNEEEASGRLDEEEENHEATLRVVTPFSMRIEVSPELRFESHIEAGHHLDALVDLLADSTEQARTIPLTAVKARKLLEGEHAYVLAGCEAWYLAYKATTMDLRPSMTPQEEEKWKELEKRFLLAQQMAKGCMDQKPMEELGDSCTMAESCSDKQYRQRQKELDSRARSWKKVVNIKGDVDLQKQVLFQGTKWWFSTKEYKPPLNRL